MKRFSVLAISLFFLSVGIVLVHSDQAVAQETVQEDTVTVYGDPQKPAGTTARGTSYETTRTSPTDPGLPERRTEKESVVKVQQREIAPTQREESVASGRAKQQKFPWVILLIVGGLAAAAAS